MDTILLPPRTDGGRQQPFPAARQLTIVGGSGAGKTRFMNYLVAGFADRAFVLSALGAVAPPAEDSSVLRLFRQRVMEKLLPAEGLHTELDMLGALLFQDEFRYLLSVKSARIIDGADVRLEPTKLDRLVEIWQDIFPGNKIMREQGRFLFATPGGDNLISTIKLSSGEKTVLYYVAAVLYAPRDGVIFVDSPSMFVHPAMLHNLWNAIEGLRPDCTFVYNTSDAEFVNSRTGNFCIWVKGHDACRMAWNYETFPQGSVPDELFTGLAGTRRPVLFIEGDATHSIDAKLYPLVFPAHTVRPLGSCNKVIEATRSFCDMRQIHHLDSYVIVDRDRRTPQEVEYLRRKNIMVPEVAEVENIFLLEDVVRIMARRRGRNPDRVVGKVKRSVLKMFGVHFREQVLQHVRHRMKRQLECRGDARVRTITELERHLRSLPSIINVRAQYDELMAEFDAIYRNADYPGVLRVFNHKPMLPDSQVAGLLGYANRNEYISGVLSVLKGHDRYARELRAAMRRVFLLPENSADDRNYCG